MRKRLLQVGLLAFVLCLAAPAATINPLLSDLTVQLADFGGGNFAGDIRGVAFAELLNPAPVGNGVVLFGDPNAPFGQSELLTLSGDFAELGTASLNFAGLSFAGGQVVVPGLYSDLLPDPSTDAALSLLRENPYLRFVLEFVSRDVVDFGNQQVTIDTFNVARVEAVPEAGTLAMAIGGLALVAAGRARRRR
ncbi:MAG: hypothetical protein HXY18_16875 [Bryobacteraceae bacterium]|nr:hypothetical protein [Bryobacteraceae bacterium]